MFVFVSFEVVCVCEMLYIYICDAMCVYVCETVCVSVSVRLCVCVYELVFAYWRRIGRRTKLCAKWQAGGRDRGWGWGGTQCQNILFPLSGTVGAVLPHWLMERKREIWKAALPSSMLTSSKLGLNLESLILISQSFDVCLGSVSFLF